MNTAHLPRLIEPLAMRIALNDYHLACLRLGLALVAGRSREAKLRARQARQAYRRAVNQEVPA